MMKLVIAAAVAGALVAAPAGWFARGLVADFIEMPAVIERLDQQCELVTERAAADAVAAEQLRQFKISERVTQRFIDQSRMAADDARARQDVLEMEIEHYAQRVISRGGGICALDADALELIGVRPPAEPDHRSGR